MLGNLFSRTIEGLTVKFSNRPDMVVKHKKHIDMNQMELPVGSYIAIEFLIERVKSN